SLASACRGRLEVQERFRFLSVGQHLSALRADDVYIGFYTLWARRGYPGIHAGMPTAQDLRSASVV
ncbi:hypothetical protein ACJ6X8_14255, partial [Pseudomonas alvandae]